VFFLVAAEVLCYPFDIAVLLQDPERCEGGSGGGEEGALWHNRDQEEYYPPVGLEIAGLS